jgi:protein SCO1
MNRLIHSVLFGLALALVSCDAAPNATPPLAGAKMGGAFSLINQDGARVSDADFAGQYRLVYFGYTFCPDVCPLDVQHLMQGFTTLETQNRAVARRIQPLFISVDPKRDTPSALKQFVRAFHPRLIGLTGTEAEIDDVAKRYGIYFERQAPQGKGGYIVNHSTNAVLYGPKGDPIAIIPQDRPPLDIANELARWVR